MIFERLIEAVLSGARLRDSADHGLEHWHAVARNGRAIAEATAGADPAVVEAFAYLHDARRENEWGDPGHGARGAELAVELHAAGALELDGGQLALVVEACRGHTDGRTSGDPTIGACWDADRLELPRVGISVDRTYLSTTAACELLVARLAR